MPRWLIIAIVLTTVAIIAIGFAGVDWRVYEWCRTLNSDRAYEMDFYRRTKWFWDAIRLPVTLPGGLVIYFLLLALHKRGWIVANAGFAAVVLTTLTAFVAQRTIARVRPNQAADKLEGYDDFVVQLQNAPQLTFMTPPVCFPSGEATGAFALATLITIAFPRFAWFVYPYAALVAVARLVQGSHFVSDLVAGAALGLLMTTGLYAILAPAAERLFTKSLNQSTT